MDATRVRPYFLPPDLNWEELPPKFLAVIEDVLIPANQKFVIDAPNAMLRSAGISLVYLLYEEALDQCDLAESRTPGGPQPGPDRAKAMDRYLRLVGAKQKVATFIDRIEKARLAANGV